MILPELIHFVGTRFLVNMPPSLCLNDELVNVNICLNDELLNVDHV